MEFVHPSYEKGQTIAAIATPPGTGGIAIIRISGCNALDIGNRIFSGPVLNYKTHTAHLGNILNIDGDTIDKGMVLIMRAPKSYTGEDTIEIHCHGGVVITRKVLEAACLAGARPAFPGEFTFKAFQNGKIDLTQAEAVQEVIASKNELAWQAAENHLEGRLYKKITRFQQQLTSITAILEAWVDFPEEGLEFASHEELVNDLQTLLEEIKDLQHTFREGKVLNTSLSLCLIGAPNVGKSSLMNALMGKDRAIVTDIAGTTRDILDEEIQCLGLTFRLLDTAGIRNTEEIVEQEGVRRSQKAAADADLILLVLDITNPGAIPNHLPKKKTLAIWNKTDLTSNAPPSIPFDNTIKISAKEGVGIESLKAMIHKMVWQAGPPSKEEVIVTSERHFHALNQAIVSIEQVLTGLNTTISPEFLVSDLRHALKALGTIIGVNITEDILSEIFSKFCVGK